MLAAQSTTYCGPRITQPQQTNLKLKRQKSELLGILMEKSVRHGTFTLSSGAISTLYVDAKQTTSDPHAALLVGAVGWEIIKRASEELNVRVDSIGGLTMGADWIALSIGIAAHLDSDTNEVKAFSVRKDAKTHGLHKLIEGSFAPGDSVVVLDDVITTGDSTIKAIKAIEGAKGRVAFVVVLVDREEGGRKAIEDLGHKVLPIFTRADLIGVDASRQSQTAAA
jgi:orotate phosphoribosyltransferase